MFRILIVLILIVSTHAGGLYLRADNTYQVVQDFITANNLNNCFWQNNGQYLALKCWREEERKTIDAYVEIISTEPALSVVV
jgi:hypothetical protein